MSTTHGFGDEAFLQFDPYEGPDSVVVSPTMNLLSSDIDSLVLDDNDSSMLIKGSEVAAGSDDPMDKGKKALRSLPIMIAPLATDLDDFVMSPTWSACSSYPNTPDAMSALSSPEASGSSSFPSFSLGSFSTVWASSVSASNPDEFGGLSADRSVVDLQDRKGKGKAAWDDEIPSTSPPLPLSPVQVIHGLFPSQVASSSSSNEPLIEQVSASVELSVAQSASTIHKVLPPPRRHSFSHSHTLTRSKHPSSLTRLKAKFSSPNRNHTRRVLSKKIITPPAQLAIPQLTPASNVHVHSPASLSLEVELPLEHDEALTANYASAHTTLKAKGRSYSSPLPMSALDYIPARPEDVFVPIVHASRNLFDEVLPKELKLEVLFSLVAIHENDRRKVLGHADWSVTKSISSKNRWLGKDRAIRELVKLSRVSKVWRDLIYDGQLWSTLDFRSFPSMPRTLISSIAKCGGRFISSIDFSGHVHVSPSTLQEITDNMCIFGSASLSIPFTQLTSINFRGCSALSTRSLHYLLVRSPRLRQVCFRGLHCVTNTTCDIIAMYCPRVTKLDMNRCHNMDAEGVKRLAAAVKARGELLQLTELRISGIRNIDDSTMSLLGQVAPFLEVLDLSYARNLHNSALDAFVALDDDEEAYKSVLLTAREAGRDPSDLRRYRRRITRLRHLSLSSCMLLTDIACSHLAYTVPRLEFLELGGIGEELGDDGLIRLLNTTPLIRRLDLEDASEITDAVLDAITPGPSSSTSSSQQPAELEPGHALEHLIISYAVGITDDALLALVQACTNLKVLEADNTRMGASVLRKFCELQRPGSKIVAVDCRSITESVVKELAPLVRPRRGWRGYDARKLRFLDGRDFGVNSKERDKEKEAIMKVALGQDELDEKRVVLKTFYSWQSVDAVWSARDKRRKGISRRKANESLDSDTEDVEGGIRVGGTRWWTPGGRRSRSASGSNSPLIIADPTADTCVIM